MSKILFSKLAETFKGIKNPDFNPDTVDGLQQIRRDLAGIDASIRTPLIERVMNVKEGIGLIDNDIRAGLQQRMEPMQQMIDSVDRRVLSDLTGKIGSLVGDTNIVCPMGQVVGTDGLCHVGLPAVPPDCPPGAIRLPSGDCSLPSSGGGGIIGGGGGVGISCKEGEHFGANVWYAYLGFNASVTALCNRFQSAEDCTKPETHPALILEPWHNLQYYMDKTKEAKRFDCWIGPFLTLFESADQLSRFDKDWNPANPLCSDVSGGGGGGGGSNGDGKKEDCCKQVCPPPIVNITNKIECPPDSQKKSPDSGDEKCPDANEYQWLTEACAVEQYELMLKRQGFEPNEIKLPDGVEYSLEDYQSVLTLKERDE